MSTTYHCHIDLHSLIEGRNGAMEWLRGFDDSTIDQSNAEVIGRAVVMRAKGRDGWPLCDHFDKQGHCKGHQTPPKVGEGYEVLT